MEKQPIAALFVDTIFQFTLITMKVFIFLQLRSLVDTDQIFTLGNTDNSTSHLNEKLKIYDHDAKHLDHVELWIQICVYQYFSMQAHALQWPDLCLMKQFIQEVITKANSLIVHILICYSDICTARKGRAGILCKCS